MKIIDAIRNVIRPDATSSYDYSVCAEEINQALGISGPYSYPDALDERFKQYPIFNWLCTDSHVGLDALYMDGEPVGCCYRSARKNYLEVEWLSKEIADQVRNIVSSYDEGKSVDLVDPDQDIGDDFVVVHVGQALTDDGFYEGRPVRALVWYDGLMGRSTDPKYRREGHSYFEKVARDDPKRNCVLVQDGDEQRVIPIEDFRLAFNTKEVDEPA